MMWDRTAQLGLEIPRTRWEHSEVSPSKAEVPQWRYLGASRERVADASKNSFHENITSFIFVFASNLVSHTLQKL